MMLAAALALTCTGGLAETVKTERVYVVAEADGTVGSVTDVVRLENPDGLDELEDRTALKEIQNAGGKETFILDGETLIWQAEGKSITYRGTSEKKPPVLPMVTLKLNGEEVSAAELKEKTGEAELTVSYLTEGEAPMLALSVLPLPETGVTDLKTENAAVITETGRSMLVGWAAPGLDESLKLPVSFSATFHADHADLGWMMTVCSSNPLQAACGEIDSRIGGDRQGELEDLITILKAMKNGEALPLVKGQIGLAAMAVNRLNNGLEELDTGAVNLTDGAKQVADGAESLKTGLNRLTENNDVLNTGAGQIFDEFLGMANQQIAASGLAEMGITVPTLTADNYAAVLDETIARLDPETLKRQLAPQGETAGPEEQKALEEKLEQAEAAREQLTGLKARLDRVSAFVGGLKDYTDGVSGAADGAGTLSEGAASLYNGVKSLQETGTSALKSNIFGAEKNAATFLLPLAENNLAGLWETWARTKGQLAAAAGYDLCPEGMKAETAYIIRTDLQ